MRAIALAALLAGFGLALPAHAYLIDADCQKNMDDGRILLSDGRIIPDGSRIRILSYTPSRVESMWSFGPCRIDVQPPNPR